jgi:hypothetical protein
MELIKQREKLSLPQRFVDEYIGVADGLVAKWETGARSPSGFLLFCWAEALNCQIHLVPKEGNPNDK